MPIWISVAIGLIIGASLLVVSVWWSFRPRPSGHRSILPEALNNPTEPNDSTVITGSGNEHP